MSRALCLSIALALLAPVFLTNVAARDSNPVVRSNGSIAAGLYASAVLQQYGPITGAMAAQEKETEISLVPAAPGKRVDVRYLATIRMKNVPVHYEDLRPVVPFDAVALRYDQTDTVSGEFDSLMETAEGIMEHRIASTRRLQPPKANGRRTTAFRRAEKEVADCTVAIMHVNYDGIEGLTARLRALPEWPWGFPRGNAITEFRQAVAAAFTAHPPVAPERNAETPDWCDPTPWLRKKR